MSHYAKTRDRNCRDIISSNLGIFTRASLYSILSVNLNSPSDCILCAVELDLNLEDAQMLYSVFVIRFLHEGDIFRRKNNSYTILVLC